MSSAPGQGSYRFTSTPPVVESLPQPIMTLSPRQLTSPQQTPMSQSSASPSYDVMGRPTGYQTPAQTPFAQQTGSALLGGMSSVLGSPLTQQAGRPGMTGLGSQAGQSVGPLTLTSLSPPSQTGGLMQGPTAALASKGLTPTRIVTRKTPEGALVAQYVKVRDTMGNQCYVDISGQAPTSMTQSMHMPLVEMASGTPGQSRLADIASMGAMAQGVIYECGETGVCAVTRTVGGTPVETTFVSADELQKFTGRGTVPIMSYKDVVSASPQKLREDLTKANTVLTDRRAAVTSNELKTEANRLMQGAEAILAFVAARNKAIEDIKASVAVLQQKLAEFAALDISKLLPADAKKLEVINTELSHRADLQNDLESAAATVLSGRVSDPDFAATVKSITQSIRQNTTDLDKAVATARQVTGAATSLAGSIAGAL